MKTFEETLLLTLKKDAFDVMVTGEKRLEFRKNSVWMKSRLFDRFGQPKLHKYIKFINGYGAHRPYFICKYRGVFRSPGAFKMSYSNGLKIDNMQVMDFIIICGEIIEKGNLKN